MDKDEDRYITKILNISSFLYASGLKLVETKKVDGDVYFIFTPKDKAEELVEKYFSDSATINPRELFARLNDLRDLIFSGGQGSPNKKNSHSVIDSKEFRWILPPERR